VRRTVIATAMFFAAASALRGQPPAPSPGLEIAFEEQTVVATGGTPGGIVVFFGVAREVEGFAARIVRRDALVSVSASEGDARLELDGPVALQSVWIVVDVTTGFSTRRCPKAPSCDCSIFPRTRSDAGPLAWTRWLTRGSSSKRFS
jgi:hypothetical protein